VIDVKRLREEPEYRAGIERKRVADGLLDRVLEADDSRRVRDELVAAGRTGPHHVHPDSGWTTKYIRDDADADEVVELLRINYDQITERRKR
jgi:hypothetical protein